MIIPRDYQQNVASAVCNFIKYTQRNGFVTSPGGSGKSIMIAMVAQACADMGLTVDILARSERLLTQNKAKLAPAYQEKAGIYCASLGEKDLTRPITIASIQSIAGQKKKTDIILCDEAHEINANSDEDTQYWNYFNACGNPRIIGFTATSFRTGSGKIKWGDEIINIPIESLFKAGHLVRPRNKAVGAPDLSDVKVNMGEYAQGELESIYTDPALLEASVRQLMQYSHDRHSCLVFGQSRRHVQMLGNVMAANGMPNIVVDGNTDKAELGNILDDFEARRFKYLLNAKLLTTGYDMPSIDMIAVLKSTKSKISWEQMLYRGTRLFPNKTDFLVLDMGGNFTEHGALGSPYTEPSKKEKVAPKGRICPNCETFVQPVTARQCPDCGYEFLKADPHKVAHDYEPDTSDNIKKSAIAEYDVTGVTYHEHLNRKKGTKSIRVDYYHQYGKVSEWYSPHSESGWARNKAWEFFRDRGKNIYVTKEQDISFYSMEDLLFYCQSLKTPTRITVDESEKFPRILKYEYQRKEESDKESAGSGDTKGASTMDEILGDDAICF